jgi:2-phospho-L-lactate transferase/gluconeogenesis factor (CofD/UPF0052 family)
MKNVVAFSGGRGSESFLKSWNSTRPFDLNLLVNPYDDGLSTGRIRDFLPGFLGPSDFRKNLVHYLHSSEDANDSYFASILEQRINSLDEAKYLLESLRSNSSEKNFELQKIRLVEALRKFESYASTSINEFDCTDCAIGNLILAGLYLDCNFDFQMAVSELCNIFNSKVGLSTVSNQNNISLVAITSNREFLGREHLIVNGLYTGAIIRLGFIESSKSRDSDFFYSGVRTEVDLSRIEKSFIYPIPSSQAASRLSNADLLCYLPGTQNSSLFPSYQILQKEIQSSRAQAKVLVMNLSRDHDMANWKRSDILSNALFHLGDVSNTNRSVTHVLLNSPSNDLSLLDGPIQEICTELSIVLISKRLANSSSPSVHSGAKIVETLKELL